jgi:hypothetical protein
MHQLLAYADDVNLLGYNIDSIRENPDSLTDTYREVFLGVNVEKTKCMLLFHCQKLGLNQDMKLVDCLKPHHSSNIWEQHNKSKCSTVGNS